MNTMQLIEYTWFRCLEPISAMSAAVGVQTTIWRKMMKISSVFTSPYLKAMDLKGKAIKVLIGEVEVTDVGGKGDPKDMKPVVHLQNRQKKWVLNKTNGATLVQSLGDETDDWFGKEVEIYSDTCIMNGEVKACLRCRVPVVNDFGVDEDVAVDF